MSGLKIGFGQIKGSFTVEAAIVVPIVLFCILWMIESGISLYGEMAGLVQQTVWEEYCPAKTFRKLEWLETMADSVKRE